MLCPLFALTKKMPSQRWSPFIIWPFPWHRRGALERVSRDPAHRTMSNPACQYSAAADNASVRFFRCSSPITIVYASLDVAHKSSSRLSLGTFYRLLLSNTNPGLSSPSPANVSACWSLLYLVGLTQSTRLNLIHYH